MTDLPTRIEAAMHTTVDVATTITAGDPDVLTAALARQVLRAAEVDHQDEGKLSARIQLEWHNRTCPEGVECRSKVLHAIADVEGQIAAEAALAVIRVDRADRYGVSVDE